MVPACVDRADCAHDPEPRPGGGPHPQRRHLVVPRSSGAGPGDPRGHQLAGQPRRHGGGRRRPAAADLPRRARQEAARHVDRRPPPRRAAARPARGRDAVAGRVRPGRLGPPARPADRPVRGGRDAAHHRPARRGLLPQPDPAGRPVAPRPRRLRPAAQARSARHPGGGVLRRDRGQLLHRDGHPPRRPARDLVRPGQVLERRLPADLRRAGPSARRSRSVADGEPRRAARRPPSPPRPGARDRPPP